MGLARYRKPYVHKLSKANRKQDDISSSAGCCGSTREIQLSGAPIVVYSCGTRLPFLLVKLPLLQLAPGRIAHRSSRKSQLAPFLASYKVALSLELMIFF